MTPRNAILHGDCTNVMRRLASESVDFCLTDPPYLCNYRSRNGQSVRNDRSGHWIYPAFRHVYRVLKRDSLCVSFYGWHKADEFLSAWRRAGFRPVGHIVFRKRYASSTRFLGATHEQACLLAKGDPAMPEQPIDDVIDWHYTGNKLHPTQKPVGSLKPLIEAFCPAGGLVLDPFAGSASTLVAAKETGRQFLGIEIDRRHWATAQRRLKTLRRVNDFSELREAA
jgi:site-specific DNA-methyltransferase (adenine-specific)